MAGFSPRLAAVAAVVILTPAVGACGYNTIPTKQERAEAAWADVQSQYQRRSDLVPNLVATVQGAAIQERTTLTQVIEARAKATSIQVTPDAPPTIEPVDGNDDPAGTDPLIQQGDVTVHESGLPGGSGGDPRTATGTMHGSYFCVAEDGEQFPCHPFQVELLPALGCLLTNNGMWTLTGFDRR